MGAGVAAGVAIGATTAAIIGSTYYALPSSGCYDQYYGGVLYLPVRIGLVLTELRRKRCLLCRRQSSLLSETRQLGWAARAAQRKDGQARVGHACGCTTSIPKR